MAHEACGFGLFSTCRMKSNDHEQPFACTENKAEVQLRNSKAKSIVLKMQEEKPRDGNRLKIDRGCRALCFIPQQGTCGSSQQ